MPKTLRVTAPYVTLKVQDPVTGPVLLGFYEGALVENVEDASAKHHVDSGLAVEASADDMPAGPPIIPEDLGTAEPAGNASREEWEAYARSKGATDEDVADLSRNEIRDLYGSSE